MGLCLFVCFSSFEFGLLACRKMTAVRMKKKRKHRCDERQAGAGNDRQGCQSHEEHVYQLVTVALCSCTGCRWLFTISSENRKENESWASAKCYCWARLLATMSLMWLEMIVILFVSSD